MSIWQKIFGKGKKIESFTEYNYEVSEAEGKVIQDFSKLDADNRLRQIITLGDSGNLKYFPLLQFAIQSDTDTGVRFAALKRIHLFKTHPDLKPMLLEMLNNKTGENLEPYFSMALSRLEIITIEEFQNKINQQSQ
jgi:hypothetical protein